MSMAILTDADKDWFNRFRTILQNWFGNKCVLAANRREDQSGGGAPALRNMHSHSAGGGGGGSPSVPRELRHSSGSLEHRLRGAPSVVGSNHSAGSGAVRRASARMRAAANRCSPGHQAPRCHAVKLSNLSEWHSGSACVLYSAGGPTAQCSQEDVTVVAGWCSLSTAA